MNGVRCGVHSDAQKVRGGAQDVLKVRDGLSRMFVKGRRVGTSEPIHVRMKLPDKREIRGVSLGVSFSR